MSSERLVVALVAPPIYGGARECSSRAYPSYGGDDRNRTCDPLLARQVLSQLSYIPKDLVAEAGFEPATSGLWAQRATNCSTPPNLFFSWHSRRPAHGQPCRWFRFRLQSWRRRRDSNPRSTFVPLAFQASAINRSATSPGGACPNELRGTRHLVRQAKMCCGGEAGKNRTPEFMRFPACTLPPGCRPLMDSYCLRGRGHQPPPYLAIPSLSQRAVDSRRPCTPAQRDNSGRRHSVPDANMPRTWL